MIQQIEKGDKNKELLIQKIGVINVNELYYDCRKDIDAQMEFKICHNEVKYSTCLRSATAKR